MESELVWHVKVQCCPCQGKGSLSGTIETSDVIRVAVAIDKDQPSGLPSQLPLFQDVNPKLWQGQLLQLSCLGCSQHVGLFASCQYCLPNIYPPWFAEDLGKVNVLPI